MLKPNERVCQRIVLTSDSSLRRAPNNKEQDEIERRHFTEGSAPGNADDCPKDKIDDAGFDNAVHVRSRVNEDTEVGWWVVVDVRLDRDAAIAVWTCPNCHLIFNRRRDRKDQFKST